METIVYLAILSLLVASFIFNLWINRLEYKSYFFPIPDELKDIYDAETLEKQKKYHLEHFNFSWKQDILFFIISFTVIAFKGLGYIDSLLRLHIENEFLITLSFFAFFGIVYFIVSLPFSYYETFVIEQKYGFNTTTIKTFWLDIAKSLLLSIILGLPLLWAIFTFYQKTGTYFWLYAWVIVIVFSLFITFFYSKIIVPLFNKQTPLPDGELKDAIFDFCKKVHFPIKEIYILDASKRTKKANAYFTGFGKNKRIVLFDTLIEQMSKEEIVAILAHEIGHYKKKHIIKSMFLSFIQIGLMLYTLSLFINVPVFNKALGAEIPSFHIGIIAFGILFSPISSVLAILFNYFSRINEKQADLFAKKHQQATHLITALKKLAAQNYSHLTPHPIIVKLNYSHPTLLDRIKLLQS
ncbi:MAG: M48 family metallopeptidase [Bacteroidales bacterium]